VTRNQANETNKDNNVEAKATSKDNEEQKENSERVKLDEILKSLFTTSNKVLVNMMNSLFKENFDVEVTKVNFGKNELDIVTDDYNIIKGDIFLKMFTEDVSQHYHIELQTRNDTTMIIRMLEYGFGKAKELQKYENKDGEEIVLYIPKQLVIFIEQNKNIQDILKIKLVFPDSQQVKYTVPVIKYWEYDDKKLIEQKMYPLLPLQIFKLRYTLETLRRRKGDHKQEQIDIIYKAKELTKIIGEEATKLFDVGEINGDDFDRILLANAALFEYLNNRYTQIEELNKEVQTTMKTLYDPAVEKRGEERGEMKGKIEDATNFLKLGVDEEIVAKGTGLALDKIKKIKQQLQKELVHF